MVHIFSPFTGHRRHIGCAVPYLIVAVLLSLGGCASVPPPDNAMNAAQSQLQAARDAQAADYAPVDLGFAQDKFQQAQSAMAQRHFDDAATLAEESRADAELARAKALLGAARAQMQVKLEENARLRARGAQAAAPAAADAGQRVPPEQPDDMPSPAASLLSEPPVGGSFQTVPKPASSTDGGFQSVPEPASSTAGGFQSVPEPARSTDNAYQSMPEPAPMGMVGHAGVQS